MHQARVSRIASIAPEVAEVDLAAVEPATIDFVPGQYLTILLPGGSDRRSYSIASPLGRRDGATLLVRQRGATAAFWTGLEPGHPIRYEGPRGDFRLADPRPPGPAVFVATGVGVAPLFPMMEQALTDGGAGPVRLYWGLDQASDLFWSERLARLATDARFASRLVLTGLGEGFVTAAVLGDLRELGELGDGTFYLCGNGQMVRDVTDGLLVGGVERARVRSDW